MKDKGSEINKNDEIRFHYDSETDIMYVTRFPHQFCSHCLELEPNIRLMVDKDAKEVLGMIFLNYYEHIPQFFKNKSFKGKKCRDCRSQKECFATNITQILQSEIILEEVKSRNKKIPSIQSDLPQRIKHLPEKAFACV